MFAAFLTTVFWSVSAVSGSRVSRLLGGVTANFWRLVVAVLFLAAYAHSFGGGLGGSALAAFVLSGVIGIGFGDVALYEAYPRLGPRLTILVVQCCSAPFGVVIEWIWMGTVLTPLQLGCGAVILLGVVLALLDVPNQHAAGNRFRIGVLVAVAAAFGNALGAVMSRRAFALVQAVGESMDGMTAAYQRVLGGLAVGAVAFAFLRLHQRRPSVRQRRNEAGSGPKRVRPPWPWVLVNGLSGLGLGMSCYQWALKTTPTGLVLAIVAITPVVTIPLTRYLDGEKPTPRSLVGGLIAVGAAVVLALQK